MTTLSLTFGEKRTYSLALVFVAGNIVLPQLCHLMHQGGLIWLPIYFFTLVGAYKYGWRVGVLTALMSPLINCMQFGMPPVAMLPIIAVKGTLLALFASLAARRVGSLWLGVLLAVVGYQAVGSLAEWAIAGSVAAWQDLTLGYPGILLQMLAAPLIIRRL